MKNQKDKKRLGAWLLFLNGNAATAWANDVAREDNSNLFVWIFLAFCALIIIAQLIPAAMVLLGFAKGVKKETLEAAPEETMKNEA